LGRSELTRLKFTQRHPARLFDRRTSSHENQKLTQFLPTNKTRGLTELTGGEASEAYPPPHNAVRRSRFRDPELFCLPIGASIPLLPPVLINEKGNIFFRLWRIPFRLALGEGLVIAESLIGIHWSGSRTEIQPRVRCTSYDMSGNKMKIIFLIPTFSFHPLFVHQTRPESSNKLFAR
jgi:hypothetical protein